jgi:ABC-2 type transport system permease protein
MIRKEFLQIRRDKQSTMMLFVLPILQTMILGYAMTRDVRNISMGILDLDRSPASSSLSERLIQNDRFVNQGHFQSMEEMRQALLAGTIILGVVIPREFALQIEGATPDAVTMESESPANITLLVDGQDAASAGTAAGYAGAIIGQWSLETLRHELLAQGMDMASLSPLDLRDRILNNPELEYSWFMVPGMLIILVTMTGALLTSFSLVRERENGTLEQLLVTPVNPIQILLGKALPYWILSQVTFFLSLGIVGWWYNIPFGRTDFLGLYIGIAFYALTSVSLGILVSTIVSSQQQALFLIWFFLIFFILTSGFMLPFESMPNWMQNLTEFNAVRHFLYMVRALILRGAPPHTLLPEYLKLVVIALILFTTSVIMFRRKAS